MGRSNNSFKSYFSNQGEGSNNKKMEPEQKLFLAILSQAIHDAFKTSDNISRDSARSWLLSNSRDFREICEFAGRDPNYVRQKIQNKIIKDKGWKI
jgi:hypothetical protein|tara:strand:+ start:316 stop:603 length:288 start_codon:yes stop_codon:yes gene_type:complete